MIKQFFCEKWGCLRGEWKHQKTKKGLEELEEWREAAKNVGRLGGEDENSAGGIRTPRNLPFILLWLRCLFLVLFMLSPSFWISQSEKQQQRIRQLDFGPYRNVDKYVRGWLFAEVLAAIAVGILHLHSVVFVWIFGFRLFDLFQSWVNQFILSSKWSPINVSRSLVLAFVGYIEIVLIGAIVKFTFGWHTGRSLLDALYDSLNTMIANPGKNASPMQYVQIMFAVLFAAAVVQHVVGSRSSAKGDGDA